MPRTILPIITLHLIFCFTAFGQVRGYTSDYWEENWRDWPRPKFDHTEESFIAVENIVLREFFPTNSNTSGELYRHYARFQYPNWESVENWASLRFLLPNYEVLEDIDFRIWEGDILLYEAREASLKDYYLDSLVSDPHSGKLFAFSLNFPELKPGHIVEVMLSVKGVPLPYNVGFHQNFPIRRSTQRIKILSAFPLQYALNEGVEVEETRIYENKIYSFNSYNCEALSLERGLSTVSKEFPVVWLDWQDQVFVYDRDDARAWPNIIDNLFYDGDLQNYVVFRNSLDKEFGVQQYFGSWIRPVRYFHERPGNFESNAALAEGRWRLTKAFGNRWLPVQETLYEITRDNKVADPAAALLMIYEAQRKASLEHLYNMSERPPVFSEYGLLCSHYEALFKYYRVDYRLALFVPARSGLPSSNYPSPWLSSARGLAFRFSDDADWEYIFPGPYLGEFLKPGTIPPDFVNGKALLFNREDTVPEIRNLKVENLQEHGFTHTREIRIRPRLGRVVSRDSMMFHGAFRSILASAYIRTDSATDQLGFTNYQLLHNAFLQDSLMVPNAVSMELKDTLVFDLPLREAISLRVRPMKDRGFAIPMAYRAEWKWDIFHKEPLKIEVPVLDLIDNPFYSWSWQWKELSEEHLQLQFVLEVKKTYLTKDEVHFYLELYEMLESKPEVQIMRKELKED